MKQCWNINYKMFFFSIGDGEIRRVNITVNIACKNPLCLNDACYKLCSYHILLLN